MRARSNRGVWLAAFLVGVCLLPVRAVAQVPPDTVISADTLSTDTALVAIPPEEVAGDTIPTALSEAAESHAVVPAIPPFPDTRPVGWYAGRWSWDREQLAQLPGLSIFDFLEQVPGLIRYRMGGFGRPAGLTALGAGGARLRVFLDGFEVDPLGTGAFQLESLALLDVNNLRVERSLSEIRVEIETFRLNDPEPYSRVELGTGAAQTRLLRALFSRGLQGRSELTGAFDIASTGGLGLREDYSHSNAAFRWSHGFNENTGVQIEWRRTGIDRAGTVFPQALTRSDFILRARRRLMEGLVVDGLIARSSAEEEADSIVPGRLRTTQAAVRAAYSVERTGVETTVRVRGLGDPESPLPSLEGEARASYRPLAGVRLEAESRVASTSGVSASEGRAVASVSPRDWLSVFGSISAGSRLVPFFSIEEFELEEGTEEVQVGDLTAVDVRGWRAGVELAGRFGSLGAALLEVGATRLVPFGLPFDRGAPEVSAGSTPGAEAYFTVTVPRTSGALRVEGWYTRFADAEERIYTPLSSGRAAIVFHDRYFDGQLEPNARVEAIHRGSARVPASPGGAFDVSTEPTQTVNFSLSIRIIDVSAFIVWDNILNTRTAIDLPGSPPAFPRIVYGASWQFTN